MNFLIATVTILAAVFSGSGIEATSTVSTPSAPSSYTNEESPCILAARKSFFQEKKKIKTRHGKRMKRCLADPDRTRNDCRWLRKLRRNEHRVNKRNLQSKVKDCTAPHTETPTRSPIDPTYLPTSKTNVPTSPPTCFTDSSIEEAVALYISDPETADEKYGKIKSWCISGVTDLSGERYIDGYDDDDYTSYHLFASTSFNEDLNSWDLSSVTSLEKTFLDAVQFNGDISDWNLSSLTHFTMCFSNAKAFNQNISTWDLSLVENFNLVFFEAEAFNQAISGWDVSVGTLFTRMFASAKSFNQCLEWSIMNEANTWRMFQDTKNGRLGEGGVCE